MVAVGLNLVFGVLRIVNVAHGSLFAIGAYTAASIGLFFAARGLPPAAGYAALLLGAALVGGVLGPLIERGVLRRVYGQEEVLQLLVTFALFMILEDVQKLVWGVQPISQDSPMKALGTVDVPFGDDTIPFTAYQLFVLPGVALATLLGLAWFLRRTLTGRVIVAVTTDKEAATAMGIDAAKVTLLTFTFGAALAALGGALASPTTSLVPGIGASDHRAVLRRGGDGGPRADRGRGADLAADRPRPQRRRLLRAGAGGRGALPHHGRGAAGAAAGPVRHGGDPTRMSPFA